MIFYSEEVPNPDSHADRDRALLRVLEHLRGVADAHPELKAERVECVLVERHGRTWIEGTLLGPKPEGEQ